MKSAVSVIVATRNRSHLLKTALEGISRQTLRPVQLVVVDDGSEPQEASSNREMVEALGGTYEYLQGNRLRGSGPSFVRNRGLSLAQADLIAFCDDDDLWIDEDHLRSCVDMFAENPDLDLVFANQEDHLHGTPVLKVRLPRLTRALGIGPAETGAGFPVPLRHRFIEYFPHLNTCVFRKSVLQSVGGFWEGTDYTEDLDLYVRAAEASRAVIYRNRTVAIHNVPDPKLAESASTRLKAIERHLAIVHVARHLLVTCRSRQAIRYARILGGEQLRVLALEVRRNGSRPSALQLAKSGLACRFTFKWALFTCYLQLRELAGRVT